MTKLLTSISRINQIKYASILLLISLLTVLTMTGCGKSVLNHSTAVLNRGLPDETSHNVSIYAYKENKVDYILTAKRIDRYYDMKRLWAYQVKIVSYDARDAVKSTIVADTCMVDEARNLVFARGHVVLDSANGKIESRIITWDRNIDEIFCPEHVKLTRDGNVLEGESLRTDSNISFAEMNSVSASGVLKGNELDW